MSSRNSPSWRCSHIARRAIHILAFVLFTLARIGAAQSSNSIFSDGANPESGNSGAAERKGTSADNEPTAGAQGDKEPAQAADTMPSATQAAPTTRPAVPVPDLASRQRATKLVYDVYGTDIAKAKLPAEKLQLAKKLLQAAINEQSDLSSRYALLTLAEENANAAASVEVAFTAIDELAGSFAVDAIVLKADAAAMVAKSLRSPQDRKEFVLRLDALVSEALTVDRYDLARQVADLALNVARLADAALARQAVARQQQVRELQTAHDDAKAATATLQRNPSDPEANLTLGKYACFVRRQWNVGLPFLARGRDDMLKHVAQLELTGAKTSVEQIALGDAWWDVAEKLNGQAKITSQDRAAEWYQLALTSTEKGLLHDKLEHRIQLVGHVERTSIPATGKEAPAQPASGAVAGNTTARITQPSLIAGTAKVLSGDQTDPVLTLTPGTKPYMLDGEYRVPEGKRLEVQSGTVIVCAARSALIVKGTLVVSGTAEKPVEFLGSTRQPASWKGITLDGVKETSLDHAYVADAEIGVNILRSKPSLTGCLIVNNNVGLSVGQMHGYGGGSHAAVLENCVCAFNKSHGINVHGGSASLTSCTVTHNGGWGIDGAYYVKLDVKKTIVSLNDSGGIQLAVYDSMVTADNSALAGNKGLDIQNKSSPQWDLRNNYWGPQLTALLKKGGATATLPNISGKARADDFLEQMPKDCGASIRQIGDQRLW